jgi:hypothetical protein
MEETAAAVDGGGMAGLSLESGPWLVVVVAWWACWKCRAGGASRFWWLSCARFVTRVPAGLVHVDYLMPTGYSLGAYGSGPN